MMASPVSSFDATTAAFTPMFNRMYFDYESERSLAAEVGALQSGIGAASAPMHAPAEAAGFPGGDPWANTSTISQVDLSILGVVHVVGNTNQGFIPRFMVYFLLLSLGLGFKLWYKLL